MTATVTWAYAKERGVTPHASFNTRCIPEALKRIEFYQDVRFVQVTSSPMISYISTRQWPNRSWAAWTTGRSVYYPAARAWQSFGQLTFVTLHETGHVKGGSAHGSAAAIMGPAINDVFKNFTQEDYRWFSWPKRRGVPDPWSAGEVNRWRPSMRTVAGEQLWLDGIEPCEVGHSRWFDRLFGWMMRTERIWVGE